MEYNDRSQAEVQARILIEMPCCIEYNLNMLNKDGWYNNVRVRKSKVEENIFAFCLVGMFFVWL